MRVAGSSAAYFPDRPRPTEAVSGPQASGEQKPASDPKQLSEDEQKRVEKLKKRDTEVRAHERAHASAGGSMAGAPHYQFETGPDGQRYAVEGDVSIQMPSSKNPAARIEEARQVKAAATAPSRPSSQDIKVAAQAAKVESEAAAELRQEQKISVCQSCGQMHGLDKIQAQITGRDRTQTSGARAQP